MKESGNLNVLNSSPSKYEQQASEKNQSKINFLENEIENLLEIMYEKGKTLFYKFYISLPEIIDSTNKQVFIITQQYSVYSFYLYLT